MNTKDNVVTKSVCGACGEVAVSEIKSDSGFDSNSVFDSTSRAAVKSARLASMGILEAKDATGPLYLCAMDRKVYDAFDTNKKCLGCGGVCSDSDRANLLEAEGFAEQMFEGIKVLDSGYDADVDIFVVQFERTDGKTAEVYFNGNDLEFVQYTVLSSEVGFKAAFTPELVTMSQAKEIATKSLEADTELQGEYNLTEVVAADFEGENAWSIGFDAPDGTSVDMFISTDGEYLGYDLYEPVVKSDEEGETKDDEVVETPEVVTEDVLEEAPGEATEDAPAEEAPVEEKSVALGATYFTEMAELELLALELGE